MPVPAQFTEPMFGPFRSMVAEVEQKGLAGSEVDEMRAQMATMERLASECGDITALTGQLAQLGTFQKFSDAYGRALTRAAQPSSDGKGGPSDEELLANTVSAYRSAVESYRSGQAGEEGRRLLPFVERMVQLAESGISYPVYLRKLEEEGLTRVLEGAAPAVRPRLEEAIETARVQWAPPVEVAAARNVLAIFDDMAARAPFGQPDSFAFNLARRAVEWEIEPSRRRWGDIIRQWESLLEDLVDWLDAHTSFAPYDERWRSPGASEAQVRRNIERTKACRPGDARYREQICGWYYGFGFDGLFRHETFVHEYTANRVGWSDARLELCAAVRPQCVPGGAPSPELVQRAEQLHAAGGDQRPGRGTLAPPDTPLRTVPFA